MLKIGSQGRVTIPKDLLDSVPELKDAKKIMLVRYSDVKDIPFVILPYNSANDITEDMICFTVKAKGPKHRFAINSIIDNNHNDFCFALKNIKGKLSICIIHEYDLHE